MPNAWPDENTAVANPRSVRGAHSRIARLPTGKPNASPMPSIMRVAIRNHRLNVAPVSAVAADHSPTEKPAARRAPNRSEISPAGRFNRKYVHRKDDSRYPTCTGVSPNSLAIAGAPIESAVRSP